MVAKFVRFLTFTALDRPEGYDSADFRAAFGVLPKEALQDAADALLSAQQSAGEQTEEYWRRRLHGFWREIWPKSRDLATAHTAEILARLAIAARGEFPTALAEVIDWLQPLERCYSVVRDSRKAGMCSKFPKDMLRLLETIVSDRSWLPKELRQCLNDIGQACPNLREDQRFRRLDEYARKRNI